MANVKGNTTTQLKKFLSENFKSFAVKRDRFMTAIQYVVELEGVNKKDAMIKIGIDGGFKHVTVFVKNPIEDSHYDKLKKFLSDRNIQCPNGFNDAQQLAYEIELNERFGDNEIFMNVMNI